MVLKDLLNAEYCHKLAWVAAELAPSNKNVEKPSNVEATTSPWTGALAYSRRSNRKPELHSFLGDKVSDGV